jgi:LysR family transcriptional activator of nhaA
MRHLNYNHLLYFATVAREGSIARAAAVLHLTPQTISGQLKLLEQEIGAPLFQRAGRGLVLTETGELVNRYAEEIFALGAELAQRVRSGAAGGPAGFSVGIVNSIPKLIAYRILKPALEVEQPLRMICYEGDLERLLADLAVHRLDLVLSDRPIPSGLGIRAYNHALGDSPVAFFAHTRIASTFVADFPRSLQDAPVLLPVHSTALRRALDEWFERQDVVPRIVAEFDDDALLKVFGEAGVGVFPAPLAIAPEVAETYNARALGVADGIQEHYFAISAERRLRHPAVVEIIAAARERLFSPPR